MKSIQPLPLLTFALFSLLLFPLAVKAQVNPESELYQALAQKDSLLFVEGFNKCHQEKFEGLLAEDLEFYHDTGGYQDRAAFFEAFNNNICSGKPAKPIRKLVPGTLEVYPLKNNGVLYGAIQKGDHEFYIREDGKEIYKTGMAKFTHLWLLNEEGDWMLKRVLSYDHKAAS